MERSFPIKHLDLGDLVFGDIEGKLDVLRVECTKCGRKVPLQRQADREVWPTGN